MFLTPITNANGKQQCNFCGQPFASAGRCDSCGGDVGLPILRPNHTPAPMEAPDDTHAATAYPPDEYGLSKGVTSIVIGGILLFTALILIVFIPALTDFMPDDHISPIQRSIHSLHRVLRLLLQASGFIGAIMILFGLIWIWLGMPSQHR